MVYHVIEADKIFRATDFNEDGGPGDNYGFIVAAVTVFKDKAAEGEQAGVVWASPEGNLVCVECMVSYEFQTAKSDIIERSVVIMCDVMPSDKTVNGNFPLQLTLIALKHYFTTKSHCPRFCRWLPAVINKSTVTCLSRNRNARSLVRSLSDLGLL